MSQILGSEKARNFITLTQSPVDRLFLELTLKENIIVWESRFSAIQQLSMEQVLKTTHFGGKFLKALNQPLYTLSGGEK